MDVLMGEMVGKVEFFQGLLLSPWKFSEANHWFIPSLLLFALAWATTWLTLEYVSWRYRQDRIVEEFVVWAENQEFWAQQIEVLEGARLYNKASEILQAEQEETREERLTAIISGIVASLQDS